MTADAHGHYSRAQDYSGLEDFLGNDAFGWSFNQASREQPGDGIQEGARERQSGSA